MDNLEKLEKAIMELDRAIADTEARTKGPSTGEDEALSRCTEAMRGAKALLFDYYAIILTKHASLWCRIEDGAEIRGWVLEAMCNSKEEAKAIVRERCPRLIEPGEDSSDQYSAYIETEDGYIAYRIGCPATDRKNEPTPQKWR